MEEENLFEIYIFMILIPLVYVVCFIYRYLYHYRDGKTRSRYLSKSLLVKSICTVLMIFFSIIHTAEACFSEAHGDEVRFVRVAFFGLLTSSWMLSLYLLIFEYQRWIASTCIGNKWFWIINLFAQGVVSVLYLTCDKDRDPLWDLINICALILGIITCSILSAFATFIPERSVNISTEPFLYLSDNSFKRALSKHKNSHVDNSVDPKIKTFIKSCKTKTEGNIQVIYFRILVMAEGKSHNVLRTPSNFERLHRTLKLKFPAEDFPSMELPTFPTFTASPPSLDLRMKAYNKYLDELCKPEFMVEALMDFLEIYGEIRNRFLESYKLVS